jgi:hypothetical protein
MWSILFFDCHNTSNRATKNSSQRKCILTVPSYSTHCMRLNRFFTNKKNRSLLQVPHKSPLMYNLRPFKIWINNNKQTKHEANTPCNPHTRIENRTKPTCKVPSPPQSSSSKHKRQTHSCCSSSSSSSSFPTAVSEHRNPFAIP